MGLTLPPCYHQRSPPILFRIKYSVFHAIWWKVLLSAIYSAGMVAMHNYVIELPEIPFQGMLGLVISLLLVFRTTTGYDREKQIKRCFTLLELGMLLIIEFLDARSKMESAGEQPHILFRIKSSVIRKIWWKVLLSILYSVAIVVLDVYVYEIPEVPFQSMLGLVVGLLLVFRTSTGYDRYWEGRRLWGDLLYRLRSMSRCIWLGVKEDGPTCIHKIEKRTAINLLISYAYAVKNYLREEYIHEADEVLEQLTQHLPRIQKRKNNFNHRKSVGDVKTKKISISASVRRKLAGTAVTIDGGHEIPINIPSELIYFFQSFMIKISKEERWTDGSTPFWLMSAVNELQNILSQLERILRTPIPLAYSIHLHQAVWLYMLTIPLQVVAKISWGTIPLQAVVSFSLLGILAIGWEIENPFGYDSNDLPLDDYCDVLRQEIESFIKRPFPAVNDWILSPKNTPFVPECYKSADQLTSLTNEELLNMLSGKDWTKEAEAENEGIIEGNKGKTNVAFQV